MFCFTYSLSITVVIAHRLFWLVRQFVQIEEGGLGRQSDESWPWLALIPIGYSKQLQLLAPQPNTPLIV